MDFNKMTQKVREAFQSAQAFAAEQGHQQVDGEHLLLALLRQEGGLAPQLFERMEASAPTAMARLEQELKKPNSRDRYSIISIAVGDSPNVVTSP